MKSLLCILLFMYGAEQAKKTEVKKQFSLELQSELSAEELKHLDPAKPIKELIHVQAPGQQRPVEKLHSREGKDKEEHQRELEEWEIFME